MLGFGAERMVEIVSSEFDEMGGMDESRSQMLIPNLLYRNNIGCQGVCWRT